MSHGLMILGTSHLEPNNDTLIEYSVIPSQRFFRRINDGWISRTAECWVVVE